MRIVRTFLPITPQCLVAAAVATVLCEQLPQSQTLTTQVNLNLLLPVKAGIVGVIAAALLSFWGYFWTEVIGPSTDLDDLPFVVKAHRRTFAYLVPALLLLFVSLGFDFYLLLVNNKSIVALQDSFGTFGASMAMLAFFIIVFSGNTLLNMADLTAAGNPPKVQEGAAGVGNDSVAR